MTNENLDNKRQVIAKLRSLFSKKCTKILLVNPPHVSEEDYDINIALDNRYPVYPPYGLGLLSRDLINRGYCVDIIDLNFDLQRLLKNNRDTFEYRIWINLLEEKLEKFNPDLIGLTCMFTITYRQVARIADFIKAFNPSLPIIAGGVHNTNASEWVLKNCESIDLIGLFEGNISFGNMIDFLNNKIGENDITQLATIVGDRYITVSRRVHATPESLNLIPHYHDLAIGEYSSLGRIGSNHWLIPPGARAATVLANRGCRGQCSFCSVRSFNGPGVFTRDIDVVVDELEMLRDQYGVTHIMWLDDDLLYDPERAVSLFNAITKRDLGITWDASNGIIASAMTEEIAQAAVESGCIALSVGIESGSPEILKSVRKPSGVKHFIRCAEIIRKHDRIFTKGLLMVGFPNETIGQIRDTIKLAQEIKLDWYTIQPLNFIPGVETTKYALTEGIITEQEIFDGTERPLVGSTGGQVRREEQEKIRALQIRDILGDDPSRVPDRSEIRDIWFLMDYEVNYRKIWEEYNPVKLEILCKLFKNMCDHTHKESALGNLYFSLIEHRRGYSQEARYRIDLARHFVDVSGYWKKRFELLGLYDELARVEGQLD